MTINKTTSIFLNNQIRIALMEFFGDVLYVIISPVTSVNMSSGVELTEIKYEDLQDGQYVKIYNQKELNKYIENLKTDKGIKVRILSFRDGVTAHQSMKLLKKLEEQSNL